MRRLHVSSLPPLAILLVPLLFASPTTAAAQGADELFDESRVQDLHLTMSARDWTDLKQDVQSSRYVAADLRWQNTTLRNVGVRARGHVIRNDRKPSLRIDLNRYLSGQRLLGMTAVVLDNAYTDPSSLRERLAMALFRRMEMAAPREAHVRLFVNQEYAGLYVLVEAVDRAFIARTFGANDAHPELGGYLYEYRWIRPYAFESLGMDLSAYAELFTPQTHVTAAMFNLFAPLRDLVQAVNDTGDERFGHEVAAQLDLAQILRYVAVENFLADEDGVLGLWGMHNFFLYRPQGGRPSIVVPWDKDTAFGAVEHPIDFHVADNVLTRRAMVHVDLRQIYFDALRRCAALALEPSPDSVESGGWLERALDAWSNSLRMAVATDPNSPFTVEEFDVEIARMRHFAQVRPHVVLEMLAEVEP